MRSILSRLSVSISLLALFQVLMAPSVGYCQAPKIGKRIDLGKLQLEALEETSGIAASRKNRDVFWLHNDSGTRSVIYAVNRQARHLGIYEIVGAQPGDWEDIAVGPGPQSGVDYLYIGNIGDNDAEHVLCYIYRVPEPRVLATQPPARVKLLGTQTIAVRYPDGPRDAETLMVDPITRDIYIISKREAQVHVYRAPYPQSVAQPITLELVAKLPISWVVAGDISSDGREILIKTYDAIYYYRRPSAAPLWHAFAREGIMLPYYLEPQGEAIAWDAEGRGYITVSEVYFKIPAHLYFYPRIDR